MPFDQYANLEKALGSKVNYDVAKTTDLDIGFQSIVVNGPRGPIKVIPDQNCTSGVAYMLQLDTWSLNSLGPAVQILDGDGAGDLLRIYNKDAYEVRCGFYGNLASTSPGYNCRIALV